LSLIHNDAPGTKKVPTRRGQGQDFGIKENLRILGLSANTRPPKRWGEYAEAGEKVS
jgi:hypothetical protein